MRGWRHRLPALAVLAGVGVWGNCQATAADDPPARSESGGWGGSLFSAKKSPAADDQTKEEERSGVFPSWGIVKPKKDKAKSAEAAQEERERAEADRRKAQARAAAESRAEAQVTLLRRLSVCDQIRLIASQTQNDELMRRADELDEKARGVYARRIARLPSSQVSAAAPAAGGPGTGHDTPTAKGVKP